MSTDTHNRYLSFNNFLLREARLLVVLPFIPPGDYSPFQALREVLVCLHRSCHNPFSEGWGILSPFYCTSGSSDHFFILSSLSWCVKKDRVQLPWVQTEEREREGGGSVRVGNRWVKRVGEKDAGARERERESNFTGTLHFSLSELKNQISYVPNLLPTKPSLRHRRHTRSPLEPLPRRVCV